MIEKPEEPKENYDITTLPYGDFSYLTSPPLKNEFNINNTSVSSPVTLESSKITQASTSHDTSQESESSENNEVSLFQETIQVEVHATNDGAQSSKEIHKEVNSQQTEKIDPQESKEVKLQISEVLNEVKKIGDCTIEIVKQ